MPVTNAVAAGLPGPNFPQRAQRTNADTVSDAPLLEENIRQTVPQFLSVVQRYRRVKNFHDVRVLSPGIIGDPCILVCPHLIGAERGQSELVLE